MTNSRAKKPERRLSRTMVHACVMALACAVGLLVGGEAFAHAKLEKSRPAPRASLKQAPEKIQLWFNEQLEPAFSTGTVVDDNGKVVSSGPARVDAADPKVLVIPLPTLASGTYEVRYQVLSVDGHKVESNFRFTVR